MTNWRILFIVDRSSATGHNEATIAHLHSMLDDSLGQGYLTRFHSVANTD